MNKWMLIVLALVFASTLAAQNERMRFQGRLMDAGGTAITTATDVTFRMYSTPTGGTALWTEAHTGGSAIVPNSNGIFSVELGATTTITGVNFSQPVYLGITVSTDAEMTPRHLFTAAGYAHHAANAASLGGVAANQFAQLGAGTVTFTGDVTASSFTGDGSNLTSLDATELVGVIPSANLSGSYAISITGSAGAFSGNLTGDVTSTGMTTTVTTVAGLAAASVTAGASLANSSTSTNTPSTIVRRDGTGGFIAGEATFNTTGGNALTVNGAALIQGGIQSNAPITVAAPITTSGPLFVTNAATPVIWGSGAAQGALSPLGVTNNPGWLLPDASGTLALTSNITGGTLAGNFTSLSVAGTGTFGGVLSANNGFNSSRTVTGAPANANGATFLVSSNAQLTFGGYGEATYTGTTPTGFQVMGLHGLVDIPTGTAGVLAIGTGGQSTDVQFGDNLGMHAWARQGGRNAGLMAVANADFNQQTAWSQSLGTIHSAILGYNNGVGANQYGLYVEGVNNRIVGNLTVTGTITGTISGTANDSLRLGGVLAANYYTSAQTDTEIQTEITALNLGTMSTQTAGSVSITGGTLDSVTITSGTFSGNGSGLTGVTSVNSAQLGSVNAAEFLQRNGSVAMTNDLNLANNTITNVLNLAVGDGGGGFAIRGTGTGGNGVEGFVSTTTGVRGSASASGTGIRGDSVGGRGGDFVSTNFFGIQATSTNFIAGLFTAGSHTSILAESLGAANANPGIVGNHFGTGDLMDLRQSNTSRFLVANDGSLTLSTGDITLASGSVNVGAASILSGTGSPETVVTAPVGSLFLRTDGGAGTTLYVKESGAGNTGWVSK